MSSNRPNNEAATRVNKGNHVWLRVKKLNCASQVLGNNKETTYNSSANTTTVTKINRPPMRGTLTSLSLCRLLNTTASSPLIALVRAVFFQSLCLYKQSIKNGAHTMATSDAAADVPNTFTTLNVRGVIF